MIRQGKSYRQLHMPARKLGQNLFLTEKDYTAGRHFSAQDPRSWYQRR